MHYDLIVIGAGQGGGPLASAFASAGRRTLVVERAHLGGTCVNEGCTPTKTMVASARVAHLARRGADYGVRDGNISVDLARVRERKRAIVESFRGGSERTLERAGATVIMGQARFVDASTIEIRGNDRAVSRATGATIVINTGLRPACPPLPGLDTVPSLDSTSIMELDAVPEHLIVLGGGYVGLEFAQMFRRFGARVTVVQRGAQLLPREDADIADALATILREDGVDVQLDTEATQAAALPGGGVRVTLRDAAEATSDLDGSHLLVATGRRPNTEDLDAPSAGIALDERGFVRVDARLATTAPDIYAIGDVNGGPAFTHVSYDDFRILHANLLDGESRSTVGRIIPYTVFTDPQLGRVGLSERDARAAGLAVRIATLPMSRVARALETDETRGFMKAIVDARSQRILGAAVLGAEGGELASAIQIAMLGDLPYTALRDGIFPHPGFAESLNNLFAALDAG
jgi:pyruvate/2-oxoglutarate dehydrogenase complex dihydrolipoamide dehydrogenase (E3) component